MSARRVGRWSSSQSRRKPRGSLRVRRLRRSKASSISAQLSKGASRTGSRFHGVRRVPSRALERRSSAEATRRKVRAASSSTRRRGGTPSETSPGSKQFRGILLERPGVSDVQHERRQAYAERDNDPGGHLEGLLVLLVEVPDEARRRMETRVAVLCHCASRFSKESRS